LNPKYVIGGVIASFIIIIAIIGFSGTSIINDLHIGNTVSTPEASREVLPILIELQDISILEVNEKDATIEVTFKISNPNNKSIILNFIKYDIFENNVRIKTSQIGESLTGMVASSNYFTILSGVPTILKDKITIQNTGNLPELWEALTSNTPKWKIIGEASFNLSSMTAGGENQITFELTHPFE
jgi:LEA14-like dessication related protein